MLPLGMGASAAGEGKEDDGEEEGAEEGAAGGVEEDSGYGACRLCLPCVRVV